MEIHFLLFFAGFIGGTMNALAGGGSGVTFAALVVSGMPPIIANATNTFAATLGYITGALGYRNHLIAVRRDLVWQVPVALVGGLLGGWLLLRTDAEIFSAAVPWLLLSATLLFMLGAQLERLAARISARQLWIIGALALFLTCIYGGYFNGGLGILTLAALSLAGYTQVRTMQGLKLIFATVSSISALVLFIGAGVVDYVGGLAVMAGIGLGSYGAARLTNYVSDKTVRHISLAICIGVTAHAFYLEYG